MNIYTPKDHSAAIKQLVVGHDYGSIFGLDKDKGQHMIYNGDISWTAKNGDSERTLNAGTQTKRAIDYINKPSIMMGV